MHLLVEFVSYNTINTMAKRLNLDPRIKNSRNSATLKRISSVIDRKKAVKDDVKSESKQKFTVKTTPEVTTKIVKLSKKFTIYGNKGGAVVKRRHGNNGGDGNLSTDYYRYVEVSGKPTFSYDGKKGIASYKVNFSFYAYEENAGNKSNRDGLEFADSIIVRENVGKESEKIGLGTKNSDSTYDAYKNVEVSVEPFAPQKSYGEAFYKGKYGNSNKSGFRNIDIADAPEAHRHQDWMSIDDVRVKFDGDGSELYGTDNLAMEGRVTFYVKVTTTTWNEYTDETAAGKNSASVMNGSYPVLDEETMNSIREVVGRGYDITGSYADSYSVRHDVLDIDKINSMKRIKHNSLNPVVIRESIKGDSLSEYSSTIESKLNVKVSVAAFGASFSNDYSSSSKTENKASENRKFVNIKSLYRKNEYEMLIDYKNGLNKDFLNPLFLEHLNSSTPASIIEMYGTHVLLGGVYGASASYMMSYIKSVSNITTAKSFSNTTTIGYQQGGGLKDTGDGEKKDKKEEKSAIAKLVDELGGIEKISPDQFKEIINSYNASLKEQNSASEKEDSQKDDKKKEESDKTASGSAAQSNGFSVSTSYSESVNESNKFENESTEENAIVYGGDWSLAREIQDGDLSKIIEWEKSLYESPNTNHWCDFVPGTLIPIYEFIPVGYKITAEEVRKAWTSYIDSKGKRLVPTQQKMLPLINGIYIRGNNSVVKNISSNDCDREISSEDRKCTGWKVRFELVNLDNGNVAVVVQYTVGESGLHANRSLLMLHYPIEVANGDGGMCVIDTTKCHNVYEAEGEFWRKNNKLIDITRFFYDCPFLDFINNPNNCVQIKLDGSGSNDSGNMEIKVDNFYIPVLTNVED